MHGWDIFNGRGFMILMRRPEFETSNDMKTVGIIIQIT